MNQALAETALRALTAPGFATESGYCWRFVRQAIMKLYGLREPPSYHRGSAKAAAYAMLEEGKAHRYNGDPGSLEIGDILLKTTGEHGHVGILTHRGIAENSSFHWRRHPGDARGLRSLEQFGTFQIVGRIPPPGAASLPPEQTGDTLASTPDSELVIAHYEGDSIIAKRLSTELRDGRNWGPIREALEAAGLEVKDGKWGGGTPAFICK